MKKILPFILILLILVNVFAPFSVGINEKKGVVVQKSVAEAAGAKVTPFKTKRTESSLTFRVLIERKTTDIHIFEYLLTNEKGTSVVRNQYGSILGFGGEYVSSLMPNPKATVKIAGLFNWNLTSDQSGLDVGWVRTDSEFTIPGLTASTDYFLSIIVQNGNTPTGVATNLDFPISTTAAGVEDVNVEQLSDTFLAMDLIIPACGIGGQSGVWGTGFSEGTVAGCGAQILYYLVFNPTSYLFALTGKFFDATFGYSIQDSSYTSSFVVEGWGLVRDFCNIFFIFVLLYIAFATILDIAHGKTKSMIINVVVIGLLINFSLFAAQMIIDTSNILARVFYNSNVIKITPGNVSGSESKIAKVGPNGEIPLSAALVNKIDPQNLIINGTKHVVIKDKVAGTESSVSTNNGVGIGAFVLITLLAIAVNVIGMVVFLSVGLIFISRVIGLWLAMIFVPLAFFSYMVPAMQNMDMVGWKKWWPETLKLAFLAPIFMFFLYLIIKFLDTGLDLINADGKEGIAWVVGIVIPFAFIMILMWKAKGIAQKMAGEFGSAMTKIGAVAGGVALGGAAMVGAGALRGTIGRAGSAMEKSEWVNRNAAKKGLVGSLARSFKSAGQAAGKGSMDIRGAKIAGMGLADTGLKKMGKAKEGGFEKMRADKVASRKKRADELKVHEDEPLKQDLNKAQVDKQKLLLESEFNISQLENQLKAARDKVKDANYELNAARGTPEEEAVRNKVSEANAVVRQLTDTKKEIKDARGSDVSFATTQVQQAKAALAAAAPEDKKKFETKVKNAQMVLDAAIASKALAESKGQDVNESRSINDYEDFIIPNAEHAIHHENQNRLSDRADYIQSGMNKFLNFVQSGGQHSSAGADQAAHAMRMDLKVSSEGKAHGGGDHGGGHAPKAPKPKAAPKDDGHGGGAAAHGH